MSPSESSRTHFAGFDWAKQNHYVVIVNAVGQIVAQFGFAHSQAGWQQWREQAARFAPLAVAIETSQGTVIDQLFQTPDCTIYPLNPKAAQRYRERKAPSWTRGALPMPCGWMVPIGSRSATKIPSWNSCGCCAATRWP